MVISSIINALFVDSNGDSIKVKIKTDPFINGSISDIINWMVANPLATIDMEDIKTGITPFFLACEHNKNDDLIEWFIDTNETDLNFINAHGLNIIDYLRKSKVKTPLIANRIKYIIQKNKSKCNL